MRIWSIHPKYLDSKGLVALWRETLLAKNVLEGKTRGYKNHPQLHRFKQNAKPNDAINEYLSEVYKEAKRRGFNFNREKIIWSFKSSNMDVTTGQLKYERQHLLNKLKIRSVDKYNEYSNEVSFKPHPIFKVIKGNIAEWEIVEKK